MPTLDRFLNYDYGSVRTPPFVPGKRYPWEEDELEQLPDLPRPQAPQQPQRSAGPSPLEPLQRALAEPPPPPPKVNPWKHAGEMATAFFLGGDAADRIWHPKYNLQLDEYSQRLEQAKAQSEAAMQEEKRQQTIAETQAKINEYNTRSSRNEAQADKANRPDKTTEMIEVTKEHGESIGIVPDTDGRYWVPTSQLGQLRPRETTPRAPSRWSIYMDAAGNDPNKALALMRADDAKKRVTGGPDKNPMTAALSDRVTTDKKKELVEVERWAAKERAAVKAAVASGKPRPPSNPLNETGGENRLGFPTFSTEREIDEWLLAEKQRIENNYADRVGAIMGNPIQPYRYPPLPQLGGQTPQVLAPLAAPTATAPLDSRVTMNKSTVKLMDPRTGEVRQFTLSPEDLRDAEAQGYKRVR